MVLAGATKLDCAIAHFQVFGYQKGELATTKLYLPDIAGGFEECDLNPLQGVFFN